MTIFDRKHAAGFGPAGWDRGDNLSDVHGCPDCGSESPDVRYMIHRLGVTVVPERQCDSEWHERK